MDKAAKRIIDAINKNETINIVGDYDVDGIVSTAIMVEFFNFLQVPINYLIPNRFEHGYGLSPKILEQIDEGLIITVDNGISAYEAAEICRQRGIDLIITDHHTVGDKLPDAYAIVNPKQHDCTYPFKEICGAQVAWYLCANIKNTMGIQYNLMDLFDILSLAIVADIMPMISLNQTIVRYGLQALNNSDKKSLQAIKERYGIQKFTEEDIGFKIAPLLNCAGRMSDPGIALEFLLSKSSFEADQNLDYLIELNEQRKQEQLAIFNDAKTQVNEDDNVIVVASDSWNEGIIGIVASKLCEKYKKPSFVFSIENDKAKASSRSTPKTHLYNLIASCQEHLMGFGGHKQAAGLSCHTKNIKAFAEQLNQNFHKMPIDKDTSSEAILGELDLNSVNHQLYNLIEAYRPFGQENPYPVFEFLDLEVINAIKIGKNKEYQKLVVSNGQIEIELLIFNDTRIVSEGEQISFLAQISKNEFRGQISFNLLLKELIH
jgi:single-stranded-DNA-specific exonuclease